MSFSSLFSSVFGTVHADAPEEKEVKEAQEEPQEEAQEEEEEPEDVRYTPHCLRRRVSHTYIAREAFPRTAGAVREHRQVRAVPEALRALRGEGQRWRGLQGRGLC